MLATRKTYVAETSFASCQKHFLLPGQKMLHLKHLSQFSHHENNVDKVPVLVITKGFPAMARVQQWLTFKSKYKSNKQVVERGRGQRKGIGRAKGERVADCFVFVKCSYGSYCSS